MGSFILTLPLPAAKLPRGHSQALLLFGPSCGLAVSRWAQPPSSHPLLLEAASGFLLHLPRWPQTHWPPTWDTVTIPSFSCSCDYLSLECSWKFLLKASKSVFFQDFCGTSNSFHQDPGDRQISPCRRSLIGIAPLRVLLWAHPSAFLFFISSAGSHKNTCSSDF